MRPATLPSLALLGLICTLAPVLASPPGKPSPSGQAQPQRASPADGDFEDTQPVQAMARNGAASQPVRAGERRRVSYASCNRESHRRNLSGGARRRFLIRCKLGYERRQPAAAPAAPTQPQQPTKRP